MDLTELEELDTSGLSIRRTKTDVCLHRKKAVQFKRTQSLETVVPSVSYDNAYYMNEDHQFGPSSCCSATWKQTIHRQRRAGLCPTSESDAIEEITGAMINDDMLMADNFHAQVLRRDTIRELAKPLAMRREIKWQLTLGRQSAQGMSKKLSWHQNFKYYLQMKVLKMQQCFSHMCHDFQFWHKDLKDIEGTFGSLTGSYFRFLQYIVFLNFAVALVMICLLLGPQLMHKHFLKEPMVNGSFPSTLSNAALKLSTPSENFGMKGFRKPRLNLLETDKEEGLIVVRSKASHSVRDSSLAVSKHIPFGPFDWLTGMGWFNSSQLYYGAYANDIANDPGETYYDISLAYFSTIFICFVIYLLIISRRVINLYKNNFVESRFPVKNSFAHKIFSAWDFNVNKEEAESLKHRSIHTELQEILQEMEDLDETESLLSKVWRAVKKVTVWIILLGFTVLVGWFLYLTLKKNANTIFTKLIEADVVTTSYSSNLLQLMFYPILVTLLTNVLPVVFDAMAQFEGYRCHKQKLYVSLIRIMFLELVMMCVLISFWYRQSHRLPEDLEMDEGTFSEHNQSKASNQSLCWESALGQEIYRLIIVDFVFFLIYYTAAEVFCLITRYRSLPFSGEFSIPRNTFHLVYNQFLVWAGLFFCPLAPIIISIKFVIIFYLQKTILMNKPSSSSHHPWKADQSETVFFVMSLITLIICFFSYAFVIIWAYCSPSCGPFQEYKHYIDYIDSLIDDGTYNFSYVITLVRRPFIIFVIMTFLVMLLYYSKNFADGRAERIMLLRRQVDLARQDRAFLLHLINSFKKGMYNSVSPERPSPFPLKAKTSHQHRKQASSRASFVFSSTGREGNDESLLEDEE